MFRYGTYYDINWAGAFFGPVWVFINGLYVWLACYAAGFVIVWFIYLLNSLFGDTPLLLGLMLVLQIYVRVLSTFLALQGYKLLEDNLFNSESQSYEVDGKIAKAKEQQNNFVTVGIALTTGVYVFLYIPSIVSGGMLGTICWIAVVLDVLMYGALLLVAWVRRKRSGVVLKLPRIKLSKALLFIAYLLGAILVLTVVLRPVFFPTEEERKFNERYEAEQRLRNDE